MRAFGFGWSPPSGPDDALPSRQTTSPHRLIARKGKALDHRPQSAAHRPDLSEDRVGGRLDARPDPLHAALASAREGDELGFAALWRALHPPLLRYLTVRGNDAPEDLAAETWLQVIRDLSSFTGGVPEFRAWLFTVARHRAIDQGRARTARPVVPVAEGRAASAEVAAVASETTADALRLVATLPPAQAEMVMLRVVEGLDVDAVATLVGKTPGAVRVAVHRGLKSLSQDPRVRSSMRGGVT